MSGLQTPAAKPEKAPPSGRRGWFCEWQAVLLVALVAAIYFPRLESPNLRGEETRRGRIAVEMLQSGDWIVPRQQGELFFSRPPLQNWLIALAGRVRGSVDWLAIRVPSVAAILLTSLLVYGYARSYVSKAAALVAGLAYATMVQVIELGRLGETEALFALAVSGSLLVWHWGWTRGLSAYLTWSLAYALVAMGMLLKGPQGPVFFAAPVFLYLIATRRWRDLITWPHTVGLLVFAVLWNAWQAPYFLAEGLEATRRIYGNDIALRFADASWGTLLSHVATYPLEILVCMLPWTPLLAVGVQRSFWGWLGKNREHAIFLLACLVATFPVCWFVPGARSRYYMPLYPCCAVLIGLAVEHCWQARPQLVWQNAWRQLLAGAAAVMLVAGAGVLILGLIPSGREFAQPWTFAIPFALAAVALAAAAWRSAAGAMPWQRVVGGVSMAAFVGLCHVGLVTNFRVSASNDTERQVAELKRQLGPGARVASYGKLDHVFTYYFEEPIEPLAAGTPVRAEYLCFNRRAVDPAQLDFAWEHVATIDCDRTKSGKSQREILVVRRLPSDEPRQATLEVPAGGTLIR